MFTSLEICAGAGGQALGLEQAGFKHVALVEIEPLACKTLRFNRPEWNVIEGDLHFFDASQYKGVDLVAGGVPCPPFSIAGKQLGHEDERNLFPEAIRIVAQCKPKAVLLENVKGLLSKRFDPYRKQIERSFKKLGYTGEWKLLQASDYGVPQLRPRAVFVAFPNENFKHFDWPLPREIKPMTVGDVLLEEMSSAGWDGAGSWSKAANQIAPTLVGGSKKHGGADLGPTRAKKAWAALSVDGKGLADAPPENRFEGMPRLTLEMTALIQGFPKEWKFCGRKTPAYRQVGNAFPPPVAKALGKSIFSLLKKVSTIEWQKEKKGQELSFENTL